MVLLYWISWKKQLENQKNMNNLRKSESELVVEHSKTLNMPFS